MGTRSVCTSRLNRLRNGREAISQRIAASSRVFYANDDRDVAKALDLAKQDSYSLPDIYGYDALAWALYKNKRFNEAAEAMTRAMALGTQDATLYAHAGLIEHERGHSAQALSYRTPRTRSVPTCSMTPTRRLRAERRRVKR